MKSIIAHQSQDTTGSPDPDAIKLARGAGVTLIGKGGGYATRFLTYIVLARLFGPEVFGLYMIGWTLLQMIGRIAPLGLDKGVIRYGSSFRSADHSRFKGVVFQSLGLAAVSGLLVGGIFYLMAPELAENAFHQPDLIPVLRWLSPAIALLSSLYVATAGTRVSQKMQYAVYAQELVQPLVNLSLILIFFAVGWDLLGAIFAGTASLAVAFVLALYYLRRLFPEIFTNQVRAALVAKELVTFSLPTSLAVIFAMSIPRMSRLLIAHFRPAADVGIYQAGHQISVLLLIVLEAFGAIFSPMIADLYEKNEMVRLDELFKVSTKWAFFGSLPLFLIIAFASQEIILVMFGVGYGDASLPLIILGIGQLINVTTGSVALLLMMSGHQSYWTLITGTMAFLNVFLNWLLIPRMGLIGAAIATACATGGLFVAALFQVNRTLGIWPYDRRHLKGVIAVAVAAGVLFRMRAVDIDSTMLYLWIVLVISVGVFITVLLLLGLDSEDEALIDLIRIFLRDRLRSIYGFGK